MDTNKILQEQVQSAPQEIGDILKSRSWLSAVENVAKKNNFLEEQKQSLENEVIFVLLGMELLENLASNLRINVGLTEAKADEVYAEIYEGLLKNIENLLPTEVEVEEKNLTPETKLEAMRRLAERMGTAPQVKHDNLPMIEEGEVVHDVPHVEETLQASAPIIPTNTTSLVVPKPEPELDNKPSQAPKSPHNPTGKDPYREPLA